MSVLFKIYVVWVSIFVEVLLLEILLYFSMHFTDLSGLLVVQIEVYEISDEQICNYSTDVR